jgi:hypothetical protein
LDNENPTILTKSVSMEEALHISSLSPVALRERPNWVLKNQFNMINTAEIIAASIRHPMHVTQAARLGCHIATVPYKVLVQMTKHPLTDKGIDQFLKDWETVPKR